MDVEKLKEALAEEARKELDKLYSELQAEIASYRMKKKAELMQRKEELKSHAVEVLQEKRKRILGRAKRKADDILIQAEERVVRRFYEAGLKSLSFLRCENYPALFANLVKEVVFAQWEEVRVNPKDIAIAKDFFKEAVIVPDNEIIGGFILTSEKGKIIINNTFEKRWERVFSSLLPEVLMELYACIGKNEKQ
ncbi:MAG: hypothetical protein OHK0040_01700 [bacterium]